jgi:hypothetical protein
MQKEISKSFHMWHGNYILWRHVCLRRSYAGKIRRSQDNKNNGPKEHNDLSYDANSQTGNIYTQVVYNARFLNRTSYLCTAWV